MSADPPPIGEWLDRGTSDPREVAATYDAWADRYDADLGNWRYQAPATVVESVLAHRADAGSVLDVGCGTGLVGQELRRRGFTGTLRGLDISAASLRVAERSGVYESLEVADLQQRLPPADDSVDAAVCVGVMTYLPGVEAIWRELARVVAPDGLVVLTQREDLWHDRDCQAIVDHLQDDGTWTALAVDGPAPYLPDGYGGTPDVPCFYLTARVR